MQNYSFVIRYVYKSNGYIESIYSIKPFSREGDILYSKAYIKSEGSLKRYCA